MSETPELGRGSVPSTFVVGEPDSSGSTVTISEAARRSGVSVSTLRRRLASGQIPGAYKAPGPDGEEWRIPVASIVETSEPSKADEVEDLRRALDEERRARETADRARETAEELLAAERRDKALMAGAIEALRESVAALSRALPPAPEVIVEAAPSSTGQATPETARRWFRRNKTPNPAP